MIVFLGCSDHVVEPVGPGDVAYVNCTMGHFALVCAIIRAVLEKAAGIKPLRRSGLAGGIFAEISNEVRRVHEFLPKDNIPSNGLRLMDGADPRRAILEEEVIPDPETSEFLEEEGVDMDDFEDNLDDALDEFET